MTQQMHHPQLDNHEITVADCGVRIHEAAGWVLGPAPDAATTSEAATVPGSDGSQKAATTDTGAAPGSDTEEKGSTP